MFENIKLKIISYIYKVSQQPIKLHDLLAANQLFQEGMKLDGSKLGFRLRLGRAYVVFLFLAHIILIPLAFLSHEVFQVLDCHASIILAIFFTALLFGMFSFFKDWTRDCVTQQRIKQMWSLHFPHFPFHEFSKEVSTIYLKAIEDEVKHSNLERYILDKLSD